MLFCSSDKNSHYWFSFDGLKTNISMNPYDHLESKEKRKERNRQFLIDNNQCLCENGVLHPMISRQGKYIPGNVYNNIKETFIKNWQSKSLLGLNLSEDIPNFINHDISDRNVRCEICITELRHDMPKKLSY